MTAWEVVGLDLSLRSTGVATARGTTTTTIVPRTGADDPVRRRHEIAERVAEFLPATVDLVVIEAMGGHWKGRTGQIVAKLHGTVEDLVFARVVPLAAVPAKSLKLWATGDGAATKEMMVEAARLLGGSPRNDDEADAACLRAMGVDHLSGQSAGRAAAGDPGGVLRVRALAGVEWPKVEARRG